MSNCLRNQDFATICKGFVSAGLQFAGKFTFPIKKFFDMVFPYIYNALLCLGAQLRSGPCGCSKITREQVNLGAVPNQEIFWLEKWVTPRNLHFIHAPPPPPPRSHTQIDENVKITDFSYRSLSKFSFSCLKIMLYRSFLLKNCLGSVVFQHYQRRLDLKK